MDVAWAARVFANCEHLFESHEQFMVFVEEGERAVHERERRHARKRLHAARDEEPHDTSAA